MRAQRFTKLDANHTSIVNDVLKRGIAVITLHQPVDTLCYHKRLGHWMLVEIKPETRATYSRQQLRFLATTDFPAAIVRTADELECCLVNQRGLTKEQKGKIAAFLIRQPASVTKWNSQEVEGELGL